MGYSSSRAPCISRLVEYSLSKVWLNQNWYRLLGFTKYTLFTITSGTFGHHPVLPWDCTISGPSSFELVNPAHSFGYFGWSFSYAVTFGHHSMNLDSGHEGRRQSTYSFCSYFIQDIFDKNANIFIEETRIGIVIFGHFLKWIYCSFCYLHAKNAVFRAKKVAEFSSRIQYIGFDFLWFDGIEKTYSDVYYELVNESLSDDVFITLRFYDHSCPRFGHFDIQNKPIHTEFVQK